MKVNGGERLLSLNSRAIYTFNRGHSFEDIKGKGTEILRTKSFQLKEKIAPLSSLLYQPRTYFLTWWLFDKIKARHSFTSLIAAALQWHNLGQKCKIYSLTSKDPQTFWFKAPNSCQLTLNALKLNTALSRESKKSAQWGVSWSWSIFHKIYSGVQ